MRFRGRRLVRKPISRKADEAKLESIQINHEQGRGSQGDDEGSRTERIMCTWGSICDESENGVCIRRLSIVEEESPDLTES